VAARGEEEGKITAALEVRKAEGAEGAEG